MAVPELIDPDELARLREYEAIWRELFYLLLPTGCFDGPNTSRVCAMREIKRLIDADAARR